MTSQQTVHLALGRIFGMMQRTSHPGDVAEYERCRALILDFSQAPTDRAPNYARDRLKGAQGD